MTKLFFLVATFCLMLPTQQVLAQSANNEDEVVKIDPMNHNAFRHNEVIVKFKEDGAVQMRAPRKAAFATTQANQVDELFLTLGVDSVEELMPLSGKQPLPARVPTYGGQSIEPKNLGKLYRLTLSEESLKQRSVYEVIDQLKTLDEVEYAEPNYLVYALASPSSYENEPLHGQQWGTKAIGLDKLWKEPLLPEKKRSVIAILDTGVDTEHPDLADNIWTNPAEKNGLSKQDDDANGFVDDLHGWDFVNNTGVMRDFNGHGTHCAGIAAAVGDNKIGITGANPNAYIMPITVLQSDGTGDVATIIKGVDYAAANGADILSMSIGTYGSSIALEQSLGRAYATAVLVAAAGNDFKCIYAHDCLVNKKGAEQNGPMFPAAYTFVLGVEASDANGNLASFSNFDEDGPIMSAYSEEQLYNYELRAPGVSIMSTYPGGRYKQLNGTSMACPLVAGAISAMLDRKEYLSKELLFGDLIHVRQNDAHNIINIHETYQITDKDRQPSLSLVTYSIADSIGGDGDGRPDAGETIAIYPTIRNAWGDAKNIKIWAKVGFYNQGTWTDDDTEMFQVVEDKVDFGKDLSSYAKAKSLNPIHIKIGKDCADGRRVNITLFATCDNVAEEMHQSTKLTVENGVEIGGMITEDMTLYPNVHYIVTKPIAVMAGVTLTIKPGTILTFRRGTGIHIETKSTKRYSISLPDKDNRTSRVITYYDPTQVGHVRAIGTPDSMIIFEASDDNAYELSLAGNPRYYQYSFKENGISHGYYNDSISEPYTESRLEYVSISNSNFPNGSFHNCQFNNCRSHVNGYEYKCVTDNQPSTLYTLCSSLSSYYSNFANFQVSLGYYEIEGYSKAYNNIIPSSNSYLYSGSSTIGTDVASIGYFGSGKESVVRRYINDINSGYGYSYYDLSNMLTRPSAEAHGIVWKILINGIDAQDEFEQLPPLGVGTHKCEVYFNRAMDTTIVPFVSYGVRPPYTQHAISQNGSWSADSTIYTAYFTIDGKTVSDGLNRLYVADAEDNEHFEIPIEKWRFNMEISAAGSMSTGLMATPGLGKVTLDWETDEEDFADLLGYNIYRWTNDTIKWDRYYDSKLKQYVEAGWRIDTTKVNENIIDSQDSSFVDFDVVPGKTYYYVIKQITTSLSSYELSNPVVATPLTAVKGDANGSMTVDVADVVTEVSYLTNGNPQPFIFEAADVNNDNTINILDVVGTINIIAHPQSQSQAVAEQGTAIYYIENGILYVESDVVLGGVQFSFNADKETSTFTPLDALKDFEKVNTWMSDDQFMFMAYSMSGQTIGIGKTALMQIGDAEMTSIVLSNTQGRNVNAVPQAVTNLDGTISHPCIRKSLESEQVVILYGDKKFNILGTEIK